MSKALDIESNFLDKFCFKVAKSFNHLFVGEKERNIF